MVEEELPFSIRTAQRLMGLAAHPVISNATYVSAFATVLVILNAIITQLPDEAIEGLIKDGSINPEMEWPMWEIEEELKKESDYNTGQLSLTCASRSIQDP